MRPALKIQTIPIEKINPAPFNPRKKLQPGDAAYEKLARSLDDFGLVEPLVWNTRTGNLVGGHQRLEVLRARGATHVPVSVVDMPPAKEKALNIALNKISGEWDREKLASLLDDLSRTHEIDMALTGFDPPDSDALIASIAGATDAAGQDTFDVAAELEAKRPVVTKLGDLIVLGRDPRLQHRLLCGDCTDPQQVRRLMNGQRAALFATDPPYLVSYTGMNHPGKRTTVNKDWSGSYGVEPASWDDPKLNPELYERFIAAAMQEAIRPDAPWYTWYASRNHSLLESAWVKAGALVHQQIVWVKSRGVLTRSWYLWKHEPCMMGWRKGNKPRARGGELRAKEPMLSTVWEVEGLSSGPERPDHPTPKPVELFAIPIRQHTRHGEVCFEPFAGSGTQIIAAQQLKRRCYACEISPRYCDLIVRRFIALAGEAAVDPKIAKRYRVGKKEVAA
jgi:DNA modification methylase